MNTKIKYSRDSKASVHILMSTLLWAFFPILVHYGVTVIPPIQLLAIITLLSLILYLPVTLWRREWPQLFKAEALPALLGVTFFIAIVPYLIIFWATQYTSGINTTLLMQSELIYTAFICWMFFGEQLPKSRLLSIGLILLGNVFILYNGTLVLSWADLAIFLAPCSFVFGNVLTKRLFHLVSPTTILTFRSAVGGLFLLFLAIPLEGLQVPVLSTWPLLLFLGIVIFGVSKIWWYQGLETMEVTKAIGISMTYPAMSLILAYFFLHEIPSLYQWIGIFVMGMGFYFNLKSGAVRYRVASV